MGEGLCVDDKFFGSEETTAAEYMDDFSEEKIVSWYVCKN